MHSNFRQHLGHSFSHCCIAIQYSSTLLGLQFVVRMPTSDFALHPQNLQSGLLSDRTSHRPRLQHPFSALNSILTLVPEFGLLISWRKRVALPWQLSDQTLNTHQALGGHRYYPDIGQHRLATDSGVRK